MSDRIFNEDTIIAISSDPAAEFDISAGDSHLPHAYSLALEAGLMQRVDGVPGEETIGLTRDGFLVMVALMSAVEADDLISLALFLPTAREGL